MCKREEGEVGLSEEEKDLEGLTYRGFMGGLIGSSDDNVKESLTSYLRINDYSKVLKTLEWLGLLSEKTISFDRGSPLDVLADLMKERLELKEGERDMVILQHEFVAEYNDRTEEMTSTFIDYGEPDGYTSIAKMVGLPAAIASRLIMEGKIDFKGVHIPVKKESYEPVLKGLEKEGVNSEERREVLKNCNVKPIGGDK